MVYQLRNEWQELKEKQGTFFAPERSVEISNEKSPNSGFILIPYHPLPFKTGSKLYARATSGYAQLNVLDMTLPTA